MPHERQNQGKGEVFVDLESKTMVKWFAVGSGSGRWKLPGLVVAKVVTVSY